MEHRSSNGPVTAMLQAHDMEAMIPTCIVVTSFGSNGSFRSRASYFNNNLIMNAFVYIPYLGLRAHIAGLV
jgi:hypothetical protein